MFVSQLAKLLTPPPNADVLNGSKAVLSARKHLTSYQRVALVQQNIIILALFNKLLDQSIPLVTVRSIVFLLTEQL